MLAVSGTSRPFILSSTNSPAVSPSQTNFSELLDTRMDSDAYPQSGSMFRPPAKRRKFPRRRTDNDNDNVPQETDSMSGTCETNAIAPRPRSQSPRDTPPETAGSSDFIRRRRFQRARRGGIEFSATSRQTADMANQSALPSATTEELEAERIKTMCDRFTAHTGQTVDVDRHMYGSALCSIPHFSFPLKWKLTR